MINTTIDRTDIFKRLKPFARLGQVKNSTLQRGVSVSMSVLEILLALAIGTCIAYVFWVLFAPSPVSENLPSPVAIGSSTVTKPVSNPFKVAEIDVAPAAALEAEPVAELLDETRLDLTLHMAWPDEQSASAILKLPNGQQKRFEQGDVIINGVRLHSVYSEYIIIDSGGVRETVRLVNREEISQSAARRPATAPRTTTPQNVSTLRDLVKISPKVIDGSLKVTVEPAGDPGEFRALGFRRGDIVTAIDNRRLGTNPTAAISGLQSKLASGPVNVTVERDGVSLPVTVDLSKIGTKNE